MDGERNLKPKIAVKEVQDEFLNMVTNQSDATIVEVNCHTKPIPDLYSFEGSLKIVQKDK